MSAVILSVLPWRRHKWHSLCISERPKKLMFYDQASPVRNHHPGSSRGAGEGGADTGVHHADPTMIRLLPEGKPPSEGAVFDHSFVAAPRTVHENVKTTASLAITPKAASV
jgi:hypothetical protein